MSAIPKLFVLSLGALAVVVASGCSTKFTIDQPVATKAPPLQPVEFEPEPDTHAQLTEDRIVIDEQVQFAYGTSAIDAESDELLDDIGALIRQSPQLAEVTIEGHTCNQGSATHNKWLSQQRAESVRRALIARGIPAELLVAEGHGEREPIANNNTQEGRQLNRRVEFHVTRTNVAPPTGAL